MFVVHEGKKALLDLFIAKEYLYDEEYPTYLLSIAGPQSVVQGIKAAFLQDNKLTTMDKNHTTLILRRPYGTSFTVRQKRLPSGCLHTLIYTNTPHFKPERTNSRREIIIYGQNEKDCIKQFFTWLKLSSIPFLEQWTPWLWQQIEKEKLKTNRGMASRIDFSLANIRELLIENIEYLKKLI